MSIRVALLTAAFTVAVPGDWECIHGNHTVEQDCIHLSSDTLLVKHGSAKRYVRMKGIMRLVEAPDSASARMAVVFWLTKPGWGQGQGLEFAVDHRKTCLQRVDYDTRETLVLEDAPYGFRVGEWVPFSAGIERLGSKDLLQVRLSIRNTRVTLKHTLTRADELPAYGLLAYRCTMDVKGVADEAY